MVGFAPGEPVSTAEAEVKVDEAGQNRTTAVTAVAEPDPSPRCSKLCQR